MRLLNQYENDSACARVIVCPVYFAWKYVGIIVSCDFIFCIGRQFKASQEVLPHSSHSNGQHGIMTRCKEEKKYIERERDMQFCS